MASSDEEGETFPHAVSDYYFYDGEDEPLSFSKLAVCWNESESKTSSTTVGPIFLRGTADNGLQKVYKQVKAWKFDLSNARPEISVLSKDNHWIKLEKPRKSFENVIRTILITVHCLYFCKGKPEASGKSLWDSLSKVFSLYDVRPSENDLIDHINFIREAVKRDETLAKSKFLAAFLENPRKRKFPEDSEMTTKPSFIVDDMNGESQDDDFITKQKEDSESDDDEDPFDSVCAICDNGGNLTCCEGKCLRSFHATVDIEEAIDSNCETLGLRPEVVKSTEQFRCNNCLYSRHQCFVCGELGSSDRSLGAEVFRCSSATCGHFYHPKCVAELLQHDGEAETHDLEKKIAVGEPFICPAHKCAVCKQTENEKVEDLQFAICRRCPRSYHRKCLPREIMFDDQIGDDDIARAWNNLLSKSRALIYCLDHEIDLELGTPARNIRFRDIDPSKEKLSELLLKKKKNNKVAIKERGIYSEHASKEKQPVLKSQKGLEKSSAVKLEDSSKKRVASSSGPESLKKRKMGDVSGKSLKRNLSTKVKTPSSNNSQPSLGSRLFDYMQKGKDLNNLENADTALDNDKQTMATKSLQKEILPPLDAKAKRRILALMEDAASSITLDEVKKYHKEKVPSTHAHSSREDKSIILARVEGSLEALNVALKKLEEGCSIEDAMAVCEPGVIAQILRWKEKLRVYLAPFLHGMRYTSFGRHFTKVEKLEKIVDKLQWYIEDGDMVVDFCCGANDFSCLVKKRLDEMGKKCSFKNYDITQPKNDFNFEKRDWMTVRPSELPSGSGLIMGLNPPFGVNAVLANRFIAKALQFKPKLIVLIVPPETERLDSEKKKLRYDLVWEDANLLSGKSFYLPGSLDINDKQMEQWNLTPPPLYLWSRPDWTSKHKAIALEHGHISKVGEASHLDENVHISDLTIENNIEMEADLLPMPLDDLPVIDKDPTGQTSETTDKAKPDTKKRKGGPTRDKDRSENKKKQIVKEKSPNQNSNKRNRRLEKPKRDNNNNRHSPSPSRRNRPQKRDDRRSSAPSRRVRAQKRNDRRSSTPSERAEAQKHDDRRSSTPSGRPEAFKLDDRRSLTPSRQDQAQKVEDKHSIASYLRDQAQILEDKHSIDPYHRDQAQIFDDKQYYSASSHRDQAQIPDNNHYLASSHRDQAQKPDDNHYLASSHRDQAQKRDDNHSPVHPRQDQSQKRDDKRPSRQDEANEALNSDLSYWEGIEPSFDKNLERRYNNFEPEESDFNFRKDVGQSYDLHLERRNNSITEDRFAGTTTYRQVDSLNLSTTSYLMRPDPVPYPSYDRLSSRGPYADEMRSRSNYPMAHQEPGFTRFNPADTSSSYNRTSTSTMQRYAPKLDELNPSRMNNLGRPDELNHTRMNNLGRPDELNHTRMNNLGRPDELNHTRMGNLGRPDELNHTRMGNLVHPEPPIVSRAMGGYGQPMPGPGLRPDPMGFAPGLYHPYTQQNNSTGGWLNE